MLVPQALAYVLNIVAVRTLSAAELSEFTTGLAIFQIFTPFAVALQLNLARLRITAPEYGTDALRQVSYFVGVSLTPLLVVVFIALKLYLETNDVALIFLLVSIPAFVTTFGFCGIFQGDRAFFSLALLNAIFGFARNLFAIASAFLLGKLTTIFLSLALGSWLTLLPYRTSWKRLVPLKNVLSIGRSIYLHAASFVVFFGLFNSDIFAARYIFGDSQAALYAIGSIVTKIWFFAPQAIATALFPDLVENRRKVFLQGLVIYGMFIISAPLVCIALPPEIWITVLSSKASVLISLFPVFALEGAVFSLAFFQMNTLVAVNASYIGMRTIVSALSACAFFLFFEIESVADLVFSFLIVGLAINVFLGLNIVQCVRGQTWYHFSAKILGRCEKNRNSGQL
jgi:O-antigen/teichoic acid export membrane protein